MNKYIYMLNFLLWRRILADVVPCQEAKQVYFEFSRDAAFSDGLQLPIGSEVTFVYPSDQNLFKFDSLSAFIECDMNSATMLGEYGDGHHVCVLNKEGSDSFTLDSHYGLDRFCGKGFKLIVKTLPCVPCNTIFLDAPFGFGKFKKLGGKWKSKRSNRTIKMHGDLWELSVGHHIFTSTSVDAADHPLVRTMWRHQGGSDFEIVLHCDICEDNPEMDCKSISVYCNDEAYSMLLRIGCPASCGYCALMRKESALSVGSIEMLTATD